MAKKRRIGPFVYFNGGSDPINQPGGGPAHEDPASQVNASQEVFQHAAPLVPVVHPLDDLELTESEPDVDVELLSSQLLSRHIPPAQEMDLFYENNVLAGVDQQGHSNLDTVDMDLEESGGEDEEEGDVDQGDNNPGDGNLPTGAAVDDVSGNNNPADGDVQGDDVDDVSGDDDAADSEMDDSRSIQGSGRHGGIQDIGADQGPEQNGNIYIDFGAEDDDLFDPLGQVDPGAAGDDLEVKNDWAEPDFDYEENNSEIMAFCLEMDIKGKTSRALRDSDILYLRNLLTHDQKTLMVELGFNYTLARRIANEIKRYKALYRDVGGVIAGAAIRGMAVRF